MNDKLPNAVAIANFLGSMDMTMDQADHVLNALRDAEAYDWNKATIDAILIGIAEKYRAVREK